MKVREPRFSKALSKALYPQIKTPNSLGIESEIYSYGAPEIRRWGIEIKIGGRVFDTEPIFVDSIEAWGFLLSLYGVIEIVLQGALGKFKVKLTSNALSRFRGLPAQYDIYWIGKWKHPNTYFSFGTMKDERAERLGDMLEAIQDIALQAFLFPDPRLKNPLKVIEQPDGWNNFQMGNNEHQTATFIGKVDPKWVVKLRGQNNEHLLFKGGQGRGRYTSDQWKSFLQNVKDNGFIPEDNGSFVMVEFGEDGRRLKIIDNLIYDEMVNKRGHNEWAYPMEEAAQFVDPDRDIIATIYEGNHRARIAYQLGIPLPIEIRFFGGAERFLEDAKRSSPLGLIYQMMKETGAI